MIFKHFVIAWQFLTVIPISKRFESSPSDLSRSMAYFPLVGFILGVILWISWKGLASIFPVAVVDLLLIAILVVLSGGIHLDGLADTVDGLWGGSDREQALKIMREPCIGAYGMIALVLVLMAKYLALTHLPHSLKGQVLLGMPAVGRWAMVVVSSFSEYARSGPGLARPFIEHLSWRQVAGSSLASVLILFLTLGIPGFIFFAILGLVSFLCLWYFRMKLGGVTGDCLGAVGELVEVTFLLSVLALQNMVHGE
jgi:adenosylcobinamide-GDP ribazoletransferase